MSRGLQRYNIFRFLMTLSVLAWTLGIFAASGRADSGMTVFLRVCAAALTGLIATTLWTRRNTAGTAFILVQLAVDIAIASVLCAITGGRESIFVVLYFPAIAAGAYLLQRPGALLAAGGSSAGFLTMLAATGALAPVADNPILPYTETMFRIFAFFLIAVLTGQLAESLARTGRELVEERRSSFLLASEHGSVLSRIRAGVLTTDASERIVAQNPFATSLLGPVTGVTLGEVFAGRAGREAWEETRPDGGRWVCSEAGLPEGGRVIVVDDITELVRMREQSARDERLVEAGRLAASMAHEIRNPLASLSGSLQLIREEQPSRLADLALGEADRLNRLVEDFLTMSTRPSVSRQRVDVLALATEVCDAFGQDNRFRGRSVVECAGTPVSAAADPDRLRQALWNLLLNGAQAMPRGGRLIVGVAPADDGEFPAVEVRVADEGVGIPEAERSRIFDPFFTRRNGGTGLGLALVDQVVRAHGGTIRVLPRPSRGTEFVVRIPREGGLGS